MPRSSPDAIDRREALRRAALVLGGVLSAPMVAGVHRFNDAMLAEAYSTQERQPFVAGLADVDRRARSAHGRSFMECPAAEQVALLETLDRAADPAFRALKELTLVGYYTSEIGATRELRHVAVPGRFEGCVPLTQIGRTWAV